MKLISPISGGNPKGADKASAMAFKNSLSGSLNDYQVLIREHLQNSSDAFNKSSSYEKLKFKISRTKLNLSNADLDGLLNLYKDYKASTNVDTEKSAMEQAIRGIENLKGDYSNIWVLRIEDNAGGLDGTSTQDYKTGSGRILSEYMTDKESYGKGSKGSFGVGKITGFVLLNKTFTVFYYNRHKSNDRDYLIGKVKLPTYFKGDVLYEENAIIGNPIKNKSGISISTWIEPDENQRSFRSLHEEGLSTIIPQFEEPKKTDDEWSGIISYSILHSFFKMFESDEIEVEIQDDLNNEVLKIDVNNYKEVYDRIGTTNFINQPGYIKNKYDYLVTKPFVFNRDEGKKVFDIDLKVTTEYFGKAMLTLYENQELKEFFELNKQQISNIDSEARKSVRLLRDGMLLRESRYPATAYPICELSGYVQFEQKLNEIVRAGENLRHDDFNYKNLDDDNVGFPAKSTVHQKFYNPLNAFVRDSIESIVRSSTIENEEYDVDINFSGSTSSANYKPSFKRTSALTSVEIPVEVMKRVFKDSKASNSDEYSTGNIEEAVIIAIPEFEEEREKNPRPNPFPNPKPIVDDDTGSSGNRKKGKKPKTLPELIFLSRLDKITNPKKEIKLYQVRIDNWVNIGADLILSQLGESKSSMVTFSLLELKINGKGHRNITSVQNKKNAVSHYIIKDIPQSSSNVLILSLEVKESLNTESNFSLKLKISNP